MALGQAQDLLGAPATRNRALCAFRGFLAWAIRSSLIDKDPTSGLKKEHETARTRVLTDDEIRTLITGFDLTRYGRVDTWSSATPDRSSSGPTCRRCR